VFATAVGFGQTTYTWTNQFPANTITPGDLGTATNWSPNGVPSPMTGPDTNGVYGDEMLWDGKTTGDLSLTANTAQTGGSGLPLGLRVHFTPKGNPEPPVWAVLAVKDRS